MTELEFVRISFLTLFEEIGICKNWNLSELEFVRNGNCQNRNLSELEFVRIGICQNWNLTNNVSSKNLSVRTEFPRIANCLATF